MAEEQRRESVIEFPQARLTAGGRLRAAREAGGFTLVDMAGQTKIPVRMLTLIEAGNYAALPAKAYATGFSRTYARALGLDEDEILAEVRRELGQADLAEARLASGFEPGDPARVPTARFAWLAAVAALAVLAAGLLLWRSYYAPAVTLPPLSEARAPGGADGVAMPAPAPVAAAPLPPAAAVNVVPQPRQPAARPAATTGALAAGPATAGEGAQPTAGGTAAAHQAATQDGPQAGPASPTQ